MSTRRPRTTLLVLVALLSSACGTATTTSPPAPPAPAGGKVHVRYLTPTSPIATSVRDARIADAAATNVMRELQLPDDVTIELGSTGSAPRYDYATRTIAIPWAFVDTAHEVLEREGYRGARLRSGVEAVVALGYDHDPGTVLATADFFRGLDAATSSSAADFFDEHSLNIQRFYALSCIIYGSDPSAYADMAASLGMSQRRLSACPEEWQRMLRNWYRLAEPHLTHEPGSLATELLSP